MKAPTRTAFAILALLLLAPMAGRAVPIAQRNFRVAIDGVAVDCLDIGGGAVPREGACASGHVKHPVDSVAPPRGGGNLFIDTCNDWIQALVLERPDTGDASWREMVAARPARRHAVTLAVMASPDGAPLRLWVFGGATAVGLKTRHRFDPCTGADVQTEVLVLRPSSLDMSAPGAGGGGGAGGCAVVADLDGDGTFGDGEYAGIAIGDPGVNGNFAGLTVDEKEITPQGGSGIAIGDPGVNGNRVKVRLPWLEVSGPMSTERPELCAWMSARVGEGVGPARKPGDMDFLVGGGAGLAPRSIHAHDCTLVRYEFGVLDASRDGLAQEMLTVECASID